MTLMLAAMVASVLLGMMFRRHEWWMRIAIFGLAVCMTTLYFVFAERFM